MQELLWDSESCEAVGQRLRMGEGGTRARIRGITYTVCEASKNRKGAGTK